VQPSDRPDGALSLVRAAKTAGPPFAVPLLVVAALVAYQLVRTARERHDRQLAGVVAEERWVGFR
jgi:predicted membrane protein